MSQMYYFEPVNKVLSEYQVGLTIGSVVINWHESRQNEIGLFKAYSTLYPTNYPMFTQKVTGSIWVKKDPGGYMGNNIPGFQQNEYSVYVQEWQIENLDEAEQEALRPQAQEVVAAEIEVRLAKLNTWASAKHISNTALPASTGIKNYINVLFALNNAAGYPFALADAVFVGSYSGWPLKSSSYEIQQLVDPV